ncbi:MAG: hypothetical protein ETSY2_43740 [Candidatus Entotheonella gemina]|uniref:Uncharacterized protein n=1 Tax=Candidatus Entotheonella gemina TaxID=1429439 RepID=W4LIZ3_9BACT|nr:MAG: hypothetical protein ETSY2_43740 [Candidatus Entotheonella gemina]
MSGERQPWQWQGAQGILGHRVTIILILGNFQIPVDSFSESSGGVRMGM